MTRFLIAALVLAAAGSAAVAQDMPLSMFLIEGESWRKADGRPPESQTLTTGRGSESATAAAYTPITGTTFLGYADKKAVYATPESAANAAAPYCPLWLKPGQDKLGVSALLVDRRGCIYAATANGLQIFDPTGRLCGVVPFPAKGDVAAMRWEGDANDVLAVALGGVKYARKLKVK